MAKSKSSTRKKPTYSKIRNPKKPKWMQVVKPIPIIVLSMLMLRVIEGIVIQYYRLASKH